MRTHRNSKYAVANILYEQAKVAFIWNQQVHDTAIEILCGKEKDTQSLVTFPPYEGVNTLAIFTQNSTAE
jgi:hypothetical protein